MNRGHVPAPGPSAASSAFARETFGCAIQRFISVSDSSINDCKGAHRAYAMRICQAAARWRSEFFALKYVVR